MPYLSDGNGVCRVCRNCDVQIRLRLTQPVSSSDQSVHSAAPDIDIEDAADTNMEDALIPSGLMSPQGRKPNVMNEGSPRTVNRQFEKQVKEASAVAQKISDRYWRVSRQVVDSKGVPSELILMVSSRTGRYYIELKGTLVTSPERFKLDPLCKADNVKQIIDSVLCEIKRSVLCPLRTTSSETLIKHNLKCQRLQEGFSSLHNTQTKLPWGLWSSRCIVWIGRVIVGDPLNVQGFVMRSQKEHTVLL